MKVTVDASKCIGAGNCVMMSPEVFDQGDDDGMVILLHESPDPELEASVEQAAAACPARVIVVSS